MLLVVEGLAGDADAAAVPDAAPDAGPDAGSDAGLDAGLDAGSDAGPDAESDAGSEAETTDEDEPGAATSEALVPELEPKPQAGKDMTTTAVRAGSSRRVPVVRRGCRRTRPRRPSFPRFAATTSGASVRHVGPVGSSDVLIMPRRRAGGPSGFCFCGAFGDLNL